MPEGTHFYNNNPMDKFFSEDGEDGKWKRKIRSRGQFYLISGE
jgi:hypothetical protein